MYATYFLMLVFYDAKRVTEYNFRPLYGEYLDTGRFSVRRFQHILSFVMFSAAVLGKRDMNICRCAFRRRCSMIHILTILVGIQKREVSAEETMRVRGTQS